MRSARAATVLVVIAMSFTTAIGAASVSAAPLEKVIVVLNDGPGRVSDIATGLARAHQGRVGFVYEHALRGFSMTVPRPALQSLMLNPQVAYVEPDFEASVAQVGSQPVPTGIDRIDADLNPPSSPMDVDIAIIDTGIYIGTNADGTSRSHPDLNLVYVVDCLDAMFYPWFGGCNGGSGANFQDGNGHGTHVAGIAAAKDNDIGSIGVAPGATLWSVKVLGADGTGFLGSILAGIDMVTQYADQIEVANMSLTMAGQAASLNTAITNSVNAGVVYVVAAGNSSADAAGFSPAAHPDVISVSAITDFDGLPGGLAPPNECWSGNDDELANYSNFGSAVDIAAPGSCIFSTYLNDGYAYASGTSMASPFVAGAVARYIAQTGHPTTSRSDVMSIRSAVLGAAVPQSDGCGFVDVADGYTEPLLSVNGVAFGGDGTCGTGAPPPPPPSNNPPVASFSSVCEGLTCTFTNSSFDPDPSDSLTYSWSFDDGSTSTERDPVHTYAAAGTYTVSLTADDGTDSGLATEVLTVAAPPPTTTTTTTTPPPTNTPPVAQFSSSCDGLACTFTNSSFDPDAGDSLTYSWTFGDGSTSTERDPVRTYAAAGTYTVSLTADDGQSSDTYTEELVVEDLPPTPMTAAVFPVSVDSDRDAEVVVWITAGTFAGVEGVTVDVVWSYLDRRDRLRTSSATGVTDVDGEAGFTIRIPKGSPISTLGFCVENAYKDGFVFVVTPTTNCWSEFPYVVDPQTSA